MNRQYRLRCGYSAISLPPSIRLRITSRLILSTRPFTACCPYQYLPAATCSISRDDLRFTKSLITDAFRSIFRNFSALLRYFHLQQRQRAYTAQLCAVPDIKIFAFQKRPVGHLRHHPNGNHYQANGAGNNLSATGHRVTGSDRSTITKQRNVLSRRRCNYVAANLHHAPCHSTADGAQPIPVV